MPPDRPRPAGRPTGNERSRTRSRRTPSTSSNPARRPDRFNGVKVWPLEPQYYATHSADERPPLERCFDKIAFREAMDPTAAYLLLDGLSNGGHKHLDGNSLPRLTLFDRIWLADNDYYKAPVKFHNSVTVFRDGQSAAIPPYVGTRRGRRIGTIRLQQDQAGEIMPESIGSAPSSGSRNSRHSSCSTN